MTYPVSIIITHFHQKKWLHDLLYYLKDSSWCGACETIVVDDFSLKENEIECIRNLFPSVKLICLDSNKGPSFARNRGVEQASGMYIQFLDADDWISPDKIKLQFTFAKIMKFPVFIFSSWDRVSSDSTPLNRFTKWTYQSPKAPISILEILTNFFPLMSGLINRKSFLEICGFDESMRMIEDVNLSIRLFHKDKNFIFKDFGKSLFFYRTDITSSLSRSNEIIFYHNVLNNYLKGISILKKERHDENSIQEFQKSSFEILWHVYLTAVSSKNIELLKRVLPQIKNIKDPSSLSIKGKKFMICKLVGFENFAKVCFLSNRI